MRSNNHLKHRPDCDGDDDKYDAIAIGMMLVSLKVHHVMIPLTMIHPTITITSFIQRMQSILEDHLSPTIMSSLKILFDHVK